MKEDLKEST